MEDRELDGLLREWKAPDAPSHLRAPRAQRWSWRWLVTGSVRVPVPVAAAAVVLAALWVVSVRTAPATPATTAETAVPRRTGELARYTLTGALAGYDAVLVELNFAPGASAPAHRHPGFIVGYVVDGRMRFSVNHEPDQIMPAGSTFFEPEGALHTGFGSASREAPVRILAFLVVPTGSRLTEPA
jgi:quercetin dioxygenase-like cupin family protein